MGNRGKPRGASTSAADNLLPTGSRRSSAGPADGRSRAERRKLQRKVKRRRRRSAIKEIPLLVGVAVLIALVLKTFLVQAFVIPSGSMEQTIQIGDRVLVDKFTPWFGSKPERGDVVVFKDPGGWLKGEQPTTKKDDPIVVKQVKEGLTFIGLLPSDDEKDLIKRVVGVGGDKVKCCDAQGRVTVNGVPLTETYLYPGNAPSSTQFDITVPQGRLWVMGDHRANSADSRAHQDTDYGGTVSENSVVGRAMVIAWPFGHMTKLKEPETNSSVSDSAVGSPPPLRRRLGLHPTIRAVRSIPEPCGTPARYGSGGPAPCMGQAAAAQSKELAWGMWRLAHGPGTTARSTADAPRRQPSRPRTAP
ncbi:hypothetical protein SALBM311S_05346 [Streptomyces alboniger]